MTLLYRKRYYPLQESTSITVKRAIDAGEPEGLVVRAGTQTAGYGRLGHIWDSPAGGLYLSLLLRPRVPDAALATLPLIGGMAAFCACEAAAEAFFDGESAGSGGTGGTDSTDSVGSVGGVGAAASDPAARAAGGTFALKWPNDVVVTRPGQEGSFTKVAGVVTEVYKGAVVLGVGIDAADLPGSPTPESLQDIFLREFDDFYAAWLIAGFAPFAEGFSALDVLRGQDVVVENALGTLLAQGIVQSVDEEGRLLVRDAAGVVNRVSSGEAHIVL